MTKNDLNGAHAMLWYGLNNYEGLDAEDQPECLKQYIGDAHELAETVGDVLNDCGIAGSELYRRLEKAKADFDCGRKSGDAFYNEVLNIACNLNEKYDVEHDCFLMNE